MRIFQVNCFCITIKDSGNPAAVVIDCDSLTQREKLSIAKKINFPVSVFVSNVTDTLPVIEYFYPEAQMPLCLHGTIAAAHLLFNMKETSGNELIFKRTYNESILGLLKVNQSSDGNILVEVQDNKIHELNLNYLELATNFLKLPQDYWSMSDNELLFNVASVGSPKLFIPVKSKEHLDNILPDYNAIATWCIDQNINGLYVYTRDSLEKNTFYARGFNPRTGHLEDAATGVAVGALACSLKQNLTVFQGANLNRPSKIHASYMGDGICMVGGLTVSGNDLIHLLEM